MAEAQDWSVEQALPLLAEMPAGLRSELTQVRIDEGGLIFRRGDRPRAMYAVLSGEARLVRATRQGGEVILQRCRSGLLAEASIDQPRYHCDAVAVLPTVLVSIPRRVFKLALLDEGFRERWLSMLLDELRRLRAQSERLSLKNAEERILHSIETEGDGGQLVLHQTRKAWAAELGLTHEALYRALARMTKQRKLTVEGGVVELIF
ncbi:MAG: Crp/Fnr family transcriptional regulator [Xanthobacteraceae bacterium]